MEVDPERTTGQDIIQIGLMDVPIGEDGKRPIVPNNKGVTSTLEVAANDHEANGSSSNSKYFLPRWCPPGLTRTQRRKLQRLKFQEKRENELEKQRDEAFNQYRPMVPQGKEWRVKTSSEPAPIRPVEELVIPVTTVRPVYLWIPLMYISLWGIMLSFFVALNILNKKGGIFSDIDYGLAFLDHLSAITIKKGYVDSG
jgi:hypothetical protein